MNFGSKTKLPASDDVKARISLKDLFEADGHILKRCGSSYVCQSPFNKEKTPSCYVHEDKGYFKCFSSGVGGDCFTYWMVTREASFHSALQALAPRAGFIIGIEAPAASPKPVIVRDQAEEVLAAPLDDGQFNYWMEACAQLKQNGAEIERIAVWRGYEPQLVFWAAERGLMGLMPYYGVQREAFLVERPEPPSGNHVPVGWHIRLGPHTPGNENPKASWRFHPKGIGSWPFLVGSISDSRGLVCLEGQWDALAFIQLMKYHVEWPEKHTAVLGMRGATSWKKFLQHYPIPKEAILVGISDRDAAGAGWAAQGGFYDKAAEKVKRVLGYWPAPESGGKDFNDLLKAGTLDRDLILHMLRTKLGKKKTLKRETFLSWCRKMVHRDDNVGRAARAVIVDKLKPKGRRPFKEWQRHWDRLQLSVEEVQMMTIAWNEWARS